MVDRLDARITSDLWFFRVAAEVESFVRAADLLAVTQSAVTQRITRLEQRLGIDLFEKSNRGVQLTSSGRMLFESTRMGFDGIEAVVRQLRVSPGNTLLRVNCVPSLALEWLTPRLTNFMSAHPGIDVALFGEMHALDRTRMAAEGIDIAIRYGPEPPSGALVVFDHPETILPVCSPAYLAKRALLGDQPVVLLHDASPWLPTANPTAEWLYWQKNRGTPWTKPCQNLFFNLAQLAYQSAMSGVGVAIGRSLIVDALLKAGRLVPAFDLEPLSGLRYYIFAQTLNVQGASALFIQWLHTEMRTPTRIGRELLI